MNRKKLVNLPKVELHCHLDGSIPMKTLIELAEKEGYTNPEEEMRGAIAPADSGTLKEYLSSFETILPLLQTKENLTEATYAVIEDANRENIVYLELRFGPLLHQRQGLSVKEIVEAVDLGIQKAADDFPVMVSLIVCALRHHSQERNTQLFEEVSQLPEGMVAAVDVAGDEGNFPNEQVRRPVSTARSLGMDMTIHSGETGSVDNVLSAMDMGTRRLGHGVAIRQDQDALQNVRAKDVLLELCPTSNIQTRAIPSFKDYPLRYFLDEGIKVCINTDNRTVSNTTVTDELMICIAHCGMTAEDLKQVMLNAITYAFTDEGTKQQVIRQIEEQYVF